MFWTPPTIAAAIGGGLSFLGGERRNRAQVSSARAQMDFQREMSNTAHQRQIKDMRAAGINPILSAKYGGASSPGGAMPQIQDTLTPAVNTGLQALQQTTQADKTAQETKKLVHETRTAFYDSFRIGATNPLKIVLQKWETITAKINLDQQEVILKSLAETLKQDKKKGLINDLKYKAMMEAIKQIGNSFPELQKLFGQ